MLAIHKDHKAIKAITAGSVAFAIGLTGAAAYTNSIIQHENLVFSQAQASKKPQPVNGTNDVQQATSPTSPVADSTGYYDIQPVQSGSVMSSTSSSSTGTVPVDTSTSSATVDPTQTDPAATVTPQPAPTLLPLCTELPPLTVQLPGENCRLL